MRPLKKFLGYPSYNYYRSRRKSSFSFLKRYPIFFIFINRNESFPFLRSSRLPFTLFF